MDHEGMSLIEKQDLKGFT